MRFSTILVLLLLLPATASAELWCASPLWVHEWGVQAFDASGAPQNPASMPGWFHRDGSSGPSSGPATRDLPADSGIRALPVLHFYSAGSLSSPISVGVEVGFRHGDARRWYPAVNTRRPASEANSARAARGRTELLRRRGAPIPIAGGADQPAVPSDPTRQLIWDRLLLTSEPQHAAHASHTPWVDALRDFDAMWVNTPRESERFVFYEAGTSERVALTLSRGQTWRPDHRHLIVRNTSSHDVHDIFFTRREGRDVYVFFAPSIPAGRSAGFVIEEHRVAASQLTAETRGRLRRRLIDSAQPAAPTNYRMDANDCVMARDPAAPVERSDGHRLYAQEVDAMLDVWAPSFFDASGTTISYREDTAYLDREMPLAIYTDKFNFVRLRRMGLAVWSHVPLP
ncbi:MAG: hypothetical protein GXP55_12655 [Deltaproteobacteria bacterium]|nr:hypothetical protein [Deltaproteobacteria bacterium]